MAQTTSALWAELWQMKNTKREYGFDIDGVWYGPDEEVEHDAESSLYSEFGIGNATTGTLSLSLYADNIPKGACIKRYVRLVNGDQASEWLPKGVFWANRRSADDDFWTIEAFDAMRKAEVVWEPDQSLTFPMTMPDAVAEFARIMGVAIDARTVLNESYTIDYPANNATIRNELAWIAAAHGGNFVITDNGELLLQPLISAPAETGHLVTETGLAITFGGKAILVSDTDTSGLGNAEGAKFYAGYDIISGTDSGKYKPVSRVTLMADDNNAVTAGDDNGHEVVADCPFATQEMVDALLVTLKGYVYQTFEAEAANVDPAAELGDGVTVNGLYSVIAHIVDDGSGYPSLSAPGEGEMEDEYPSAGPMEQAFTRKLAATHSLITKTAEQIRQEVTNEVEGLSSAFTVELDSISGEIAGIENAFSELELTVDSFSTRIQDAEGSVAQLELTVDAFSVDLDNLDVRMDNIDGLTVTDNYGITRIRGSSIETDTLYVNAANITGTVVAGALKGSEIALTDGSGNSVGTMSLQHSSTYAFDLTSNLSLRMRAASGYNAYIGVNNGAGVGCYGSGNYAGYVGLHGLLYMTNNYGTSLPTSGKTGQVFFLLDS